MVKKIKKKDILKEMKEDEETQDMDEDFTHLKEENKNLKKLNAIYEEQQNLGSTKVYRYHHLIQIRNQTEAIKEQTEMLRKAINQIGGHLFKDKKMAEEEEETEEEEEEEEDEED